MGTRHFLGVLSHDGFNLLFDQLMGVHGLWDRGLLHDLVFSHLLERASIRVVALVVAVEAGHHVVGGILGE